MSEEEARSNEMQDGKPLYVDNTHAMPVMESNFKVSHHTHTPIVITHNYYMYMYFNEDTMNEAHNVRYFTSANLHSQGNHIMRRRR